MDVGLGDLKSSLQTETIQQFCYLWYSPVLELQWWLINDPIYYIIRAKVEHQEETKDLFFLNCDYLLCVKGCFAMMPYF